MKREVWLLLIFLSIVFLGIFFIGDKVTGHAVSLIASSTNVNVGEEVKVDVMVSSITNLSGIQMDIAYDPSILNYKDIGEGSFLSEGGLILTYFDKSEIQTSSGNLKNIIIFRRGKEVGVTGSGTLFSIYFNAVSSGTSNIKLASVLLSNSEGESITTPSINTAVTVSAGDAELSEDEEGCTEDWSGSWTQCINKQHTFICVDKNSCGTDEFKPELCREVRDCVGECVVTEPVLKETQTVDVVSPTSISTLEDFGPDIKIKKIQIEVKAEAEDVSITISEYDGRPAAVPEKSGKIYSYLKIDTQNLEGNLEKGIITPQVERSWISDNGLTEDDIVLFRYDEDSEKWDELQTTLVESDDKYHYYEAELNAFSYFVITGKVSIIEEIREGRISLWLFILAVVAVLVLAGVVLWQGRQISRRRSL